MVAIALLTRKVRRRALTRSHTHWLLVCSTAGRATQVWALLAPELEHPHGKTGEGTGGSAADSAQAWCGRLRAALWRWATLKWALLALGLVPAFFFVRLPLAMTVVVGVTFGT